MPNPKRLSSARQKVLWAEKRAVEIRALLESFLAGGPIQLAERTVGRKVEIIARTSTAVPEELALCVGDWAHNLRSALDHLVFAYVEDENDKRRCQFPGWNRESPPTEQQWRARVAQDVPGTGAGRLRTVLEGLQPFQGGREEALWALTQLDNIDKHRIVLNVAVSIATTSHETSGQWVSERELPYLSTFQQSLLFGLSVDPIPSHPLIRDPVPSDMFSDARLVVEYSVPEPPPVTQGDVLYTFPRHEWHSIISVTPNYQLVFGSEPLRFQSVLEQVGALGAAVTQVIDRM